MKNQEFVEKLMLLACEADIQDSLYWDENFTFSLRCNDVFWWGCADTEDITEENFPILKETLALLPNFYGVLLFICRVRQMRPQGAFFEFLPKDKYEMFKAFGDKRPIDTMNPKEIPES